MVSLEIASTETVLEKVLLEALTDLSQERSVENFGRTENVGRFVSPSKL